ncbi:hypothetical protein [Muricoccus radiodurans]|uniref:hypothetical protein n=1 Tax=Muricoccus radiodurans TaxID=2231721 RepID=UPI003CF61BFE
MATHVVSYQRDTSYVTNISKGATCYAVLGTMTVGGTTFRTFERFSMMADRPENDFPHLAPGDYTTAVMYWHGKLGRVINPYNGTGPSKRYNNVLVHAGSRPSHFEGCIGPGTLEGAGVTAKMTRGDQAMAFIWKSCGGNAADKKGWSIRALKVLLRVENAFPGKAGLTLYTG